ncbi:MAG: hypothetical protein ACD_62C00597G0003 [uncultured bacterium]|nr:MAG: hypothetical protein ACD_62C00597G0003 [uncultured bacterium]
MKCCGSIVFLGDTASYYIDAACGANLCPAERDQSFG